MNRKAIVFDVDKSLSTIGDKDKQAEVFGVEPVTVIGGIDTINGYMDNFLQVIKTPIQHPLLGETGEDVTIEFNETGKELGVNTLIIDSISILGMQERNVLMKAESLLTMERQTWGIYGGKMTKFINKLSKCSFSVVCTSHTKRDKDENGAPIEVPALKGASADEAGRFFDVVAYAKINKDAQGRHSEYTWVVNADRRYIMAKNRRGVLGNKPIPQDLSLIYEKYAEIGIYDPKILIIGDTGQGKSWSLQTLNGAEDGGEEETSTIQSETNE